MNTSTPDGTASTTEATNQKTTLTVTYIPLPMVLITQIQRSGGTLLSQLFDGHPQICAHPHELHIGRPQKWNWPNLDMSDSPDVWFASLYEKRLEDFLEAGYVKPGGNPHARKEVHPFSFNPRIQQAVFLKAAGSMKIQSQRDILNIYFTSFFAAWSDVELAPESKYVTAFCPRVLMFEDSIERYVADYPDGHFISSVRDPRTWYASSSRHSNIYADVREAIDMWKTSTSQIIALKKARPDYIFISTYDKIVNKTEETMTSAAAFIGIDFNESLLMPTYASKPILPNSSYARNSYGVNADSTKTSSELSKDDLSYIEREAMPLYEEAAAL